MFKKVSAIVMVIVMATALSVTTFAAPLRIESRDPGLLPLRAVAEGLGASVGWNEATRTATVSLDGVSINVAVDQPLPGGFGSAVIIDDRTFVPYSFLVEELGISIAWDQRVAYINNWANVEPVPMPTVDPIASAPMPLIDQYPVAADDGPTAYELFILANDALLNAGSFLMTMDTYMTMTVLDETIETLMTGTIAQVIRSETDIDMRMEMTAFEDGQGFTSVTYFRDGIMYVNMLDEWIAMEIPIEELMQQTGIITFPEDAIVSQQVVGTDYGTGLNFTISGEAMADVMNAGLAAFGELLGGLEMDLGDVIVRSIIDADGIMRIMEMYMDMVLEIEGMTIELSTTISSEITQVGGIEINFPAELDDI